MNFESPDDLPLEAIGKLISAISSEEWIEMYEQSRLMTKAGRVREILRVRGPRTANFRHVKTDRDTVHQPLAEGDLLHPGDEVEVHLIIRSKAPAEYVHLRDPRPAGLEPGLATSGYRYDLGLIRYEETRDSGTNGPD
jgi:hypothetical protein